MTRSAKKKANLRDVARTAGVSAATVSRVMTGSAAVSADTRERVEKAIEALKFVPSSAARAINSGRTRLIGALIPTLDHSIFARFIDNVEEVLDARGLSLIVANTRHDSIQELEKTRKLLDIGVEGLLISGNTREKGFDALIRRYDVPVISTSFYQPLSAYPTIGYDNAAVAQDALRHLFHLGHRDIAIVSGPSHNNDRTHDRLRGARLMKGIRLHVEETDLSFAGAGDALHQALQNAPATTAVLCLSDVLAQGVLQELRRTKAIPSQSISVMGIDDLPTSAHFDPPLTTMHLPVNRMGVAAANAIADWVEHGILPPHTRLESKLVVRSSTFAVPRASDPDVDRS